MFEKWECRLFLILNMYDDMCRLFLILNMYDDMCRLFLILNMYDDIVPWTQPVSFFESFLET